jgi:hypothetical protein
VLTRQLLTVKGTIKLKDKDGNIQEVTLDKKGGLTGKKNRD